MIYFSRRPPPTVAWQGEGSNAATESENKGAEGVRADVYTKSDEALQSVWVW